jgi:DNA invertase Pin-like site-specific DNA recombinase
VSTRDQHPEAQTDALTAAGCVEVFTDQASGTLARRPALDEALRYLRAGDTLVVTKLDRLGRSVRHLKQIADELQVRDVGLRALSQGIDSTTPGGRLFLPPPGRDRRVLCYLDTPVRWLPPGGDGSSLMN